MRREEKKREERQREGTGREESRRERHPPDAPTTPRTFALRPLQTVGISVLALIPILGVFGVLGERTSALDVIGRVAFVYVFLMVAFRFAGKRELSEMSPFELVTALLIPEIFSAALNRSDETLSHATIGVATLFVLVFVTGLLTFRFKAVEKVVEGEAALLVRDGKLLPGNLKRERVTTDELFAEMHKAGVDRLEEVRWAILEVDGKIAVIPRTTAPQDERVVG
jgi:uncharacterized membrane protein YcaP (DUF421 family)